MFFTLSGNASRSDPTIFPAFSAAILKSSLFSVKGQPKVINPQHYNSHKEDLNGRVYEILKYTMKALKGGLNFISFSSNKVQD